MKTLAILTGICLFLSGCGASKLTKTRDEIKLQQKERDLLVQKLRWERPDNWREVLLSHDKDRIAQRRQSHMSLTTRRMWILHESNLMVEHINWAKEEQDRINTEYSSFLLALSDDQLERYQAVLSANPLNTPEGFEIAIRKIEKILSPEQFKSLVDYKQKQIDMNSRLQEIRSTATVLLEEDRDVSQALQVEYRQRVALIQAFGQSLKASAAQRPTKSRVYIPSSSGSKIRTNAFGQIIDNTGRTLNYSYDNVGY